MADKHDNRIEDDRYTLTDNQTGRSARLRRITPTYGKPAIDVSGPIRTDEGIRKGGIRAVFGTEVHDPAFKSTASGLSEITYIDGEAGVLLHRGYNISDLTENKTYTDVVSLLLDEKFPSDEQRKAVERDMVAAMELPSIAYKIIGTFDRDAAPMDMLAAAVNAIAAQNKEDNDPRDIVAQVPALVANIIRYKQGKSQFLRPTHSLGFTENFLSMMFANDQGQYTINPVLTRAMDKLLILHADHEQNASTTAVRGTRSAGSKMATSIAAGINTLAGPLHGGANQKVLEQLEWIAQNSQGQSLDETIDSIIARAKDKNDDFRLMGFGHRVYKNRDPRALVLKQFVDDLLNDLGVEDERLAIARKLEEKAVADPYFQERKLYPNVDFYSGIAMAAMDLEPELFTLIFAAGRVSGWVAQAEELDRSKQPICRPRQQYMGAEERPVTGP